MESPIVWISIWYPLLVCVTWAKYLFGVEFPYLYDGDSSGTCLIELSEK